MTRSTGTPPSAAPASTSSSGGAANQNPAPRTGTSYAWQHRHDLPGAPSRLDRMDTASPAFRNEGRQGDDTGSEGQSREARRESFMVRRSQPVPVLRPSPQLSLGVDRAVFNARWQQESEAANDRAARRAAFEKMRASRDPKPTRNFNRTVRR